MERDALYPIVAQFEGGPIYSDGLARLLSYVAAAVLLFVTAKKLGEPFSYAVTAVIALIVGAYLGGRLGFMRVNLNQPGVGGTILDFSAGYVFHTALLSGVVASGVTGIHSQRRQRAPGRQVLA